MSTDKMDTSAVYTLFEELKQKIVELSKQTPQPVQADLGIDTDRLTVLLEELRTLASHKQFTPEQIKELQENMAGFTGHALNKSAEKWDKGFSAVIDLVKQISEKVKSINVPSNSVIRKEHIFSLDFKNSKAAITMIVTGLCCLLLFVGNIWQLDQNRKLEDNDLKYRHIKMLGEADRESLFKLETDFTYNRNTDSIAMIRKRVETYERLVKEQAEKIEQVRLNTKEVEGLQKQVEMLKGR